MDALTPLCGIIVSGNDGDTRHERVFRRHAPDCQRARFARTDDQRARAVACALRRGDSPSLLTHKAEHEADAAHEEDQKEAGDNEYPDGKPGTDNPQKHGAAQRAEHGCADDLDDLIDAGIFP